MVDPIPLPPALIAPKVSSFQFRPTDDEVPIDQPIAPPRPLDEEGIVVVTNAGGFLKGIPIPILSLAVYTPGALQEVYGVTKTDLLAMDAYIAGYTCGRADVVATQEQRRKKRELSKARRLKRLLAIALENEA